MGQSSMTFYDFIGKFIPGVLICVFIDLCRGDFVVLSCNEGTMWYLVLFIVCYIIGLVYDYLIRFISEKLKLNRNTCLLVKTRKAVYKKTGKDGDTSNSDIRQSYDIAYYTCMKSGILGNVPVLEAHENFIKRIYPILLSYLILVICQCDMLKCEDRGIIGSMIVVALCLLPFVWYRIQKTIFLLVWEGEYYAKKD